MVKKEVFIGIIVGFIANIVGIVLSILILHDDPSILEVIRKSFEEGILSKLISLGAIMNLFVFLVYIKKRQDHRAKGILFTTVFLAITTLILNII